MRVQPDDMLAKVADYKHLQQTKSPFLEESRGRLKRDFILEWWHFCPWWSLLRHLEKRVSLILKRFVLSLSAGLKRFSTPNAISIPRLPSGLFFWAWAQIVIVWNLEALVSDLRSLVTGMGEYFGKICILRQAKYVVTCLHTMVSMSTRVGRETYNACIVCIEGPFFLSKAFIRPSWLIYKLMMLVCYCKVLTCGADKQAWLQPKPLKSPNPPNLQRRPPAPDSWNRCNQMTCWQKS